MIVELCNSDLLALVNGEQVAVKDIIVRPTEADVSTVEGERSSIHEEHVRGAANRRESFARTPKTGQRWMRAIYPHGRCSAACTKTWGKGELMLWDYDTKRALCPEHGQQEFPNLPIPEEVR